MPDGNVENRNKMPPCWTMTELQGLWVYLFRNLRQTQHPERYSFVFFCLFYYKVTGNFTNKVPGEQKLREIDKRIASGVPESTSQPRSPNDSLRAVGE